MPRPRLLGSLQISFVITQKAEIQPQCSIFEIINLSSKINEHNSPRICQKKPLKLTIKKLFYNLAYATAQRTILTQTAARSHEPRALGKRRRLRSILHFVRVCLTHQKLTLSQIPLVLAN